MNFLDNNKVKKYVFIAFVLILNIAFIGLRVFDINRPLWNDELISLSTLQVNPLENPLYNGVSTNLPLFYYLIKLGSFFTISGVDLRFVSFILSIITLNLVLYFYSKNKSFSLLLLSILITLSPIQIYYSQELRTYMLTQLILLTIFLEVRKILNQEKINYWFFSILIFLSLISHYTSFIFVPGIFLYLVFSKKLGEKLLKSFVIPALIAGIIFIGISGNEGFSNSTDNSILNLNFQRLTMFHLTENIKKTNEVLTIYYNYGLHYYRLDGFFTSMFKKFMYLVFLGGAFFFFQKKAPDSDFRYSSVLLLIVILLSIVFDMLGFIPFGGRYLFPFNFLYLFVLAKILEKIYLFNKLVFVFVFSIFITSYLTYNVCLIRNLNTYTGNNDPQGILIQGCFN